jgi:hypothetical protein
MFMADSFDERLLPPGTTTVAASVVRLTGVTSIKVGRHIQRSGNHDGPVPTL